MVRFEADTGRWLVPVERVLEVRPASELRPLPDPDDTVAGVIERGARAVAVSTALGAEGSHVLVVVAGGEPVGIIARRVVGVVDLAPGALRPPPVGQARHFVVATAGSAESFEFVLDADQLVHTFDHSREEVA